MNRKKVIYIGILFIVTVIVSITYFSYAYLTRVDEQHGKINVVVGILDYKIESSELDSNNTVTVNGTKIFDIDITSLNDIDSNYSLYYTSTDSNVLVEYISDQNLDSGQIDAHEKKTIKIRITTTSQTDITFGLKSGFTHNTIALDDNENRLVQGEIVTAPTIAGANSNWVTTNQTITIAEAGTATSGVAGYEYYKTTSSTAPTSTTTPTGTLTTSPYSLTVTDIGKVCIYYRTVSNNGNKSSWSNVQIVRRNSTSVVDLTGHGNNATISGATFTDDGLSFDGVNDFISTNNVLNYNGSTAVTVEFTAKFTSSSLGMIFESSDNWNTNAGSYGLTLNEHNNDGELSVTTHYSEGYNIKKADNVSGIGSFQKYVVVINYANSYNNFIDIYVDGIKQTLSLVSNNNQHSYNFSNRTFPNYKLYIGSRAGAATFMSMILKDFKVYNRALSQTEINNNLNGNTTTSGLLLHYNFE